jgi:hypothetical protein
LLFSKRPRRLKKPLSFLRKWSSLLLPTTQLVCLRKMAVFPTSKKLMSPLHEK